MYFEKYQVNKVVFKSKFDLDVYIDMNKCLSICYMLCVRLGFEELGLMRCVLFSFEVYYYFFNVVAMELVFYYF